MAPVTTVRVFGKPITHAHHGSRHQRALAALKNMHADGKSDHATQFTNELKKTTPATVSTTIGKVYNATGDEVKYVTVKNWSGSVVGTYPVSIMNGQWAVFQHVGTKGNDRQGSVAAVVYGIEDFADIMVAWNNPWKTATGGNNTAYCEMNGPGYFGDSYDWDAAYQKLLKSETETTTTMSGYGTKVSIEAGGNAPVYTAIFYVET
ncbi:uncharacterized protein LOC111901161 [Lactuca sativa]|uniref:Uncharacterized protein n=1 Tax=Lactuca sativa TaxID=4236 RepID=A0A9R1X7R1_LACSA|nr:uncharacterized protein LOC111901161 [Lactuca sativa]KAJ0198812.1 hypothetical protein LSAT_V11C600331740 [Lactuca sativa]